MKNCTSLSPWYLYLYQTFKVATVLFLLSYTSLLCIHRIPNNEGHDQLFLSWVLNDPASLTYLTHFLTLNKRCQPSKHRRVLDSEPILGPTQRGEVSARPPSAELERHAGQVRQLVGGPATWRLLIGPLGRRLRREPLLGEREGVDSWRRGGLVGRREELLRLLFELVCLQPRMPSLHSDGLEEQHQRGLR